MEHKQNKHYIIIGAMKCGTTSLFHSLSKHCPSIKASRVKDTKFFVDQERGGNWEKGLDWYLTMFPQSGGIKLEASTHYAKYPDYPGVAARIKQCLQNVKLIYLVRDPLRRAISHFFHNLLVDKELLDINVAFSSSGNKYLHYSDYALQLSQYHDYFEPEEILTLNLVEEDDQTESLARLKRFLEIENHPFVLERSNTTKHNFVKAQEKMSIDPNIIHHSADNIERALKFGLNHNTLCKMIHQCSEHAMRFQKIYPFSIENWLKDYENYL
jgi:hypothetical protein